MALPYAHDIDITVRVNGRAVRAVVQPRTTLLDWLREEVGLTGTKKGCNEGACGTCTVLVDGKRMNGCLTLAVQCDGGAVETIEGVAASGEIADLQAAFATANALQCGFCTPAMLLTAQELLRDRPSPTGAEIRAGLSGNYCRCTGYHAIIEAILATARRRREGGRG